MGGKVLIIGGAASARIVLKSRLAQACYDVTTATDPAAALGLVQASPVEDLPEAFVIDLDQQGGGALDMVRALRAHPVLSTRPMIAVCADPRSETALSALEAGVDDLFGRPLSDAALQARLRNLLRARDRLADMVGGAPDAAGVALSGLAEAAAGFEGPGRFVVVAADDEAQFALRRTLAPLVHAGLRSMTPEAALSGDAGAAADVIVVAADRGAPDAALRLLSELRSRGMGKSSAVCLARPAPDAGLDAMAFDLGASAVIDPAAPARATAARLRRVLRRQREEERTRSAIRSHLRLAAIDPLTGLSNRRHAMAALAGIETAARRSGQAYAVLIADLDRFKQVNDRHGHSAGDAVLVGAAERLRAQLRPGDLIARIGGEEFLIALPDVTLPEARRIAERLCRTMAERPVYLPQGGSVQVTVSIGLAVSDPGAEAGVQPLIDAADQALLSAKATGRNQVKTGLTAA